MKNAWYSNMIMYSVDVELFYDGDGDGIGDFVGLTEKLDYLAGLGINCLWILPFYPSPDRDNGYDVMDYYQVDERLGSLGDFSQFMEKANSLGIRIIIDLVINHTSIEHPWFQQARADPDSPYHDYYVWSVDKPVFDRDKLHFVGEENAVWTYDRKARKYYLHRFYKEQPDLNIANPRVREEICGIMGFWLNFGVAGFRVDAAEMLVEPYGLDGVTKDNLVEFLTEMRAYASFRKGDVLLLGEANAEFSEMDTFVGQPGKLNMMFNFPTNQLFFLALATQSAEPLERAIKALADLHPSHQFLNFLRHHDELSLTLLAKKNYQQVVEAFATDESMRIYERGIRRRLPPMLENNTQRLKLSFSLQFSLPGVPMIRYGDEIAMGEDLRLKGRNSVRTAMQWTDSKNGGFSSCEKGIFHPVISEGEYGYSRVNVAKAQNDPKSFLNWVERLITARKQCAGVIKGDVNVIPHKANGLLVHQVEDLNESIVFIHNLTDKAINVKSKELPVTENEYYDFFVDPDAIKENSGWRINPYGYVWLKSFSH